ncbi:hypothetical protein [Cupriavidus sp. 8B]
MTEASLFEAIEEQWHIVGRPKAKRGMAERRSRGRRSPLPEPGTNVDEMVAANDTAFSSPVQEIDYSRPASIFNLEQQ